MNSVNIKNRKARYNYHVLDKYVSGIVLSGNEIKSIRESKASLNNCYCEFDSNNELNVINMNIDEYAYSNEKDYSPQKKRKLLLLYALRLLDILREYLPHTPEKTQKKGLNALHNIFQKKIP